jgi:adenine-specific DNA-methyltransferase
MVEYHSDVDHEGNRPMTSSDPNEIEQIDIYETSSRTPNFRTELAAQLSELIPEAIADGKVDVEKLKELLDDDAADSSERFGLFWPGKKRALRAAQEPTTATLKPDVENSKDWDTTKNVFIEGDNLEVLKILQKHYHGKVKMIYIDPPYNTGKDFVYPDNYKEGLETYLQWTKQVNEEGKKVNTNSESEGRYHSNWLNMMYPRLKLARNLLSDDGAIFVSIDFNEADNLKKMMDEIFGEANFQREIVWRIGWLSGYKTMADNFIRNHDSMFFYSKNHNSTGFIKKYIQNADFKPLVKKNADVTAKFNELGLDAEAQSDLLHFINHGNRPERYPIEDTWNSNEYDDLNSIAIVSFSGEKVSKLLDTGDEFKGQKSVKMLKRTLESMTSGDDIVLDFFAGTSSTAHAVMELNAEDGGSRRFIMVQLPEPTEEGSASRAAGFATIADISRKRIDVAGDKIADAQGLATPDVGFRAFALADTNFAKWRVDSGEDANRLERHLLALRDSADDDATPESLLTELLLKQGYSLTERIGDAEIDGLKLKSIGEGLVLAYLDEHHKPTLQQLRAILGSKDLAKFIILEDTFQGDDELKTNLMQEAKTRGVELWTA